MKNKEDVYKKKKELIEKHPEFINILDNIQRTNNLLEKNKGPKTVVLISGSEEDQKYLKERFNKTKIFGNAKIISFHEKIRKQTFLGTLNFYKELKNLEKKNKEIKNSVILCGMVFGKGERLSPITNALKNMKPSLPMPKSIIIDGEIIQETILESALKYFSLVSCYLEDREFKGVLDVWGDQIQIPGVDLFSKNLNFKEVDIVRNISESVVTPELAKNKEWVCFDNKGNFIRQIPRRPIDEFEELYKNGVVQKNEKGEYVSGVNLGPVAVSYKFLDVAIEVFSDEIKKEGCYFDFDPYFLMALAISGEKNNRELWEKERNSKVDELDKMIVKNSYGDNFFDKVCFLRKKFIETYKRDLNMKVLNLGTVFWADIGQHKVMRETFMSLIKDDKEGFVSRELASIPHEVDEKGNRIINSKIGDNVEFFNSVIINSSILNGKIKNSIIVNGIYYNAIIENAFSIGDKVYSIKAFPGSGSIYSIYDGHLELSEGLRHVSVPLPDGVYHLKVHESEDLTNNDKLNNPILDNKKSFRELYTDLTKINRKDFFKLRKIREKIVLKKIYGGENGIYT